jgi:hypothetical protein
VVLTARNARRRRGAGDFGEWQRRARRPMACGCPRRLAPGPPRPHLSGSVPTTN